MQTVRSIIYMIGMVVLIVLAVIGMMLVFPLPRSVMYKLLRWWNYSSMRWLEICCQLYYEVTGADNIPPQGGFIILAKHQSAWETLALQEIFTYPTTWVLKRTLLWVPFFGWGLSMIRSIGINRASGKVALKQLITEGQERLDAGIKIIIFPEGTRIESGKIGKFKIGGSILSEKTGYAIVPVAHNAGRYWPRRGIVKHPGTIKVIVGQPISPIGKSAQQINQEVYHWMQTAMTGIEGNS